jgi:GMC oxidoreductase
MTYELKGKLSTSSGKPLSYYTIKAYDKDPPFDILGDDPLGSDVTLDDGTFKITFKKEDFRKPAEFWEFPNAEPNVYLKVFDNNGTQIHETPSFINPFIPYNIPNQLNQTEVVVIGSGFGGTIVSLSVVNQLHEEDRLLPDSSKRKVILLERGQWWISHEVPSTKGFNEHQSTDPAKYKLGVREYLETNDISYRTWAYPDNVNGLPKFLNTLRIVDRRGLYDYRISKNVHTLSASGVGGGSLVYANVTEPPHDSVIDKWDKELNLGINHTNLSQYFEMAKGFIGVNKITTTSGLSSYKLPKTKAFQDAAEKIRNENPRIVTNETTFSPSDPDQSTSIEDIFAVDLSITDISSREDEITLFNKASYLQDSTGNYSYSTVLDNIKTNPKAQEKLAVLVRKYSSEPNVCERQGRCVLGCVPLSRHLNSRKLFDYLYHQTKKNHFEVYALSEVYDIEPLTSGSYRYRVYYTDFGAREWKQATFSWNNGPESYKLDTKFFRLIDEGKKRTLDCKRLVLAAGAIGSTEILLKSVNTTRTTGQKLNLSHRLGMRYSTNGDLLGVVNPTKTNIHATRGPIVTSAIKFNEGSGFVYTIEDSSIPKMFSGISKLISRGSSFRSLLGFVGSGSTQSIIDMIITTNPSGISIGTTNLPLQISEEDLTKTLLLSGMGTDTSDGIIRLQDSWKKDPERNMNALNVLNIDFDPNKLIPLFTKMRNSMEKIAKHLGEGGSASFSTPLWDPVNVDNSLTIVLHNLGGCSMGKDRDSGVVDNFGRVYKGNAAIPTETYVDFYIVDGGIVPTSIGVNSSLTISALAFRIAEKIVSSSSYLPVEPATLGTKTIYFPK